MTKEIFQFYAYVYGRFHQLRGLFRGADNGLEQTLVPVGVCLVNQDGENDLVGYSYLHSMPRFLRSMIYFDGR